MICPLEIHVYVQNSDGFSIRSLAETEYFGQNYAFWLKQPLLAEKSVSAESPKEEKAERPKPKHISAEIFGRNRTETVFG